MDISTGRDMQGPLIAVVDDDASIRDTTSDLLESAGYSAVAFSSPGDILASERLAQFTCLITDMRMPGLRGRELPARPAPARARVSDLSRSAMSCRAFRA